MDRLTPEFLQFDFEIIDFTYSLVKRCDGKNAWLTT